MTARPFSGRRIGKTGGARYDARAQGQAAKRAGSAFEDEIARGHQLYRARGLGVLKRQYPRVVGSPGAMRYADDDEGVGVDFIGHLDGVPVAFDCKRVTGMSYSLDTSRGVAVLRRQAGQVRFLLDFARRRNAAAFLLLHDPDLSRVWILHRETDLAALVSGKAVPIRTRRNPLHSYDSLLPVLAPSAPAELSRGVPLWDYRSVLPLTFPSLFPDAPAPPPL